VLTSCLAPDVSHEKCPRSHKGIFASFSLPA